ncbi:Calmodulin and related proteins (EF-Hand superfamily) [Abeliophyllum distichum]|uniref:Calmodulin and related proteins (EF-Hand superfamily) n=1 Tax=Abeliophyllum distichum TaxID=126358 RepID=A0ABD1RWG7_9LAMI
MGFKSLFNRKKKQRLPVSDSNSMPINSRSSSLNSRAQIEEELEQVFNKFDVNGDRKISASELGSIMGSLGHPATDEELEIMIKEDGNGMISFDEFKVMMMTGSRFDAAVEPKIG